MHFTCLQPAEVGLKPERDSLEKESGGRGLQFIQRGALDVPQPTQQFPTMGVYDADRVGQPAGGRDQLEVELRQALLSSNRFERHLVNYFGVLAQGTVATVEIGGRSFDELAGHTWTTVMEASRHGSYDAVKRDAMAELTEHQRGLRSTYGPVFNSLVPESWSGLTAGVGFQPEEIDVALARTELRWRPMPADGTPIQFRLRQIDGCLRLDVWSGDAGLVPLVAHLTATDAVRTPEQAHTRCMAVLAHHPTAISPRHYVICRTAPSDPADPAAWPAPLATGTGRT